MELRNKVGEQRLYKLFGHFSILSALVFGVSSLNATSFEDFKKSQMSSFTKYVDERDSEFKGYLDQQFLEYKSFLSEPLYEKPKPRRMSATKAKPVKSAGPRIKIKLKDIVKKNEVEVIPADVKKDIEFAFFGTKVGFNYDFKIKNAKFYPLNQKGIANFFEVLASSDYSYIIEQIEKSAKDMNLNDWGIYLLVNEISSQIFLNKDDADIFSWFLFNKLGFDVRVGIASRHIVLMHYSKKTIYSTPNFKFGEKKFYVIANYAKGGLGSVYSYEQGYPDASKPIDLALETLPHFSLDERKKTLSFKEYGKKYQFTYSYNQNLVDFMATYPQADYQTYFDAPLDELTYISVANGLKKYVDNKQASSAINFVLHFVQNAFEYQVDQKQFSREKVMFANETLYYDKSDCEDRAILFSNLVKKMFKIRVLGVKYSDHMSTALYVPLKGDNIKIKSKKFVLADPTYINSNIGQSMPRYKSIIPDSYIVVK